MKMHTLTGF